MLENDKEKKAYLFALLRSLRARLDVSFITCHISTILDFVWPFFSPQWTFGSVVGCNN